MVTYPAEKTAKITATTRNAAGMPVKPVVAYAVGITPAATVSGATPASTNDSTAGTPRRSRASADDTLFRLAACWVRDIVSTPLSGGVVGPGAGVRDGGPAARRRPWPG